MLNFWKGRGLVGLGKLVFVHINEHNYVNPFLERYSFAELFMQLHKTYIYIYINIPWAKVGAKAWERGLLWLHVSLINFYRDSL